MIYLNMELLNLFIYNQANVYKIVSKIGKDFVLVNIYNTTIYILS